MIIADLTTLKGQGIDLLKSEAICITSNWQIQTCTLKKSIYTRFNITLALRFFLTEALRLNMKKIDLDNYKVIYGSLVSLFKFPEDWRWLIYLCLP
jgi:hypothetical protein